MARPDKFHLSALQASGLLTLLGCLVFCSTALADVEADYRTAVAADKPLGHYSFSEVGDRQFGAPPDAPPTESITCSVWKDPLTRKSEARLLILCFQGGKNGLTTYFPSIREVRVISAPEGVEEPSIVGLRQLPGQGRFDEKPLDDGSSAATVAKVEMKAGDGDPGEKEWVLQPHTMQYAMPEIRIRPFAKRESGVSCLGGSLPPDFLQRSQFLPGGISNSDCLTSVWASFSECASAADLEPIGGAGAGRYCLQRAGSKPRLQKGPFAGSKAMALGTGESFLLGLPSADRWSGRFTLEYWARWRGRFGSAATMKFGDKLIATGFACDGTGALTTFDVLSSPAVPPPGCKSLEGGTFSVVASSVGLSHSEWHHIALVRTENEMQMWVDGARNNDGAVVGVPPVPSKIGVGYSELSPATETLVAEPALYLDALSGEQISAHYAGGRKGSDTLCGIGNDDLFLGEASGDKLSGAKGADDLQGGPGNDTLNGGPGNDALDGGPGDDKTGEVPRPDCKGESLAGNDQIEAGPGNDQMQGGPGSDRIDGGPGRDLLDGGPGADVIESADGERDVVKCGPGRDTVTADGVDRLIGCESVRR